MVGIVNSASAPPLRQFDEAADEPDPVPEAAARIEQALNVQQAATKLFAAQTARAKMARTVNDIAWMLQL